MQVSGLRTGNCNDLDDIRVMFGAIVPVNDVLVDQLGVGELSEAVTGIVDAAHADAAVQRHLGHQEGVHLVDVVVGQDPHVRDVQRHAASFRNVHIPATHSIQ